MAKEKPCSTTLDYADKAFFWWKTVKQIEEGNPYANTGRLSIRKQWINATAKVWYYEDLRDYTVKNQKEPSEVVKKKIWENAKILAELENKKAPVPLPMGR